MNLISIVSCGYFGFGIEEGYTYYCVDLPNILASKDISPDIKTAEDLSPRLSIFGIEGYTYYCVDLPNILASKDISPDIKTAEDLSPKLSVKE